MEPGDRCRVDDVARSALEHVRNERGGSADEPQNVHLDDPAPIVNGDTLGRTEERYSRIVHEYVDSTHGGERLVTQASHIGVTRYIAAYAEGARTSLGERLYGLVYSLLMDVRNDN